MRAISNMMNFEVEIKIYSYGNEKIKIPQNHSWNAGLPFNRLRLVEIN